MLCLALAACTIEVGPPPESDPPLVPESAKRPPPPPQPTEPQPWSRDLNFESGPTRIDQEVLAEGLVAGEPQVAYSRERLTYESAFNAERPPTEAELVRQRARERAAAAGLPPPPEVSAAPVPSVSEQRLPPVGGDGQASGRRESRLPPPPKFPTQLTAGETAAGTPDAEASAEQSDAAGEVGAAAPARPESRLPPPPKLPPAPAMPVAAAETADQEPPAAEDAAEAPQLAAVGETPAAAVSPDPVPAATEAAAAAVAEPGAAMADSQTEAFVAEAWDAPSGTILVQVSAVQQKAKVSDEWARLRARYPEVLKPLRLVIDEAKLGERGVFYRVQAGAFGTEAGATEACDSLISQGQACFVVVR